jgi:hypothetical protein
MEKLVAVIVFVTFISPTSLCLAREANRDALRSEIKAQQAQQEMNSSLLKAVESEAAKSVKSLTDRTIQVPQT